MSGRITMLALVFAIVVLALAGWTLQALLWAPRRLRAAARSRRPPQAYASGARAV